MQKIIYISPFSLHDEASPEVSQIRSLLNFLATRGLEIYVATMPAFESIGPENIDPALFELMRLQKNRIDQGHIHYAYSPCPKANLYSLEVQYQRTFLANFTYWVKELQPDLVLTHTTDILIGSILLEAARCQVPTALFLTRQPFAGSDLNLFDLFLSTNPKLTQQYLQPIGRKAVNVGSWLTDITACHDPMIIGGHIFDPLDPQANQRAQANTQESSAQPTSADPTSAHPKAAAEKVTAGKAERAKGDEGAKGAAEAENANIADKTESADSQTLQGETQESLSQDLNKNDLKIKVDAPMPEAVACPCLFHHVGPILQVIQEYHEQCLQALDHGQKLPQVSLSELEAKLPDLSYGHTKASTVQSTASTTPKTEAPHEVLIFDPNVEHGLNLILRAQAAALALNNASSNVDQVQAPGNDPLQQLKFVFLESHKDQLKTAYQKIMQRTVHTLRIHPEVLQIDPLLATLAQQSYADFIAQPNVEVVNAHTDLVNKLQTGEIFLALHQDNIPPVAAAQALGFGLKVIGVAGQNLGSGVTYLQLSEKVWQENGVVTLENAQPLLAALREASTLRKAERYHSALQSLLSLNSLEHALRCYLALTPLLELHVSTRPTAYLNSMYRDATDKRSQIAESIYYGGQSILNSQS